MNTLQESRRQKRKPEHGPDSAEPTSTLKSRGLACEVEIVSESASLDGEPFRLLSNPMFDGRELASACWRSMRTQVARGFQPYLLILIASPMYLESAVTPLLRGGIETQFAELGFAGLPMIVSSFSENVFGPHKKNTGAVLICVGSRSANGGEVACSAKSDWNESAMFGLPS